MAITCNMIGFQHCGKELQPEDIGNQCAAHFNMGNKPHEWRVLYQCKACHEEEKRLESTCAPEQNTWSDRRRKIDLSISEMARKAGLGAAVYSQLEHRKLAATPEVGRVIERILKGSA